MTGYPIIMNGDHAEFEIEHKDTPLHERPDWPLPSFDARDWAAAFCKIANAHGFKSAEGEPIDEGWMIGWFANSLMRGFDEHAARSPRGRSAKNRRQKRSTEVTPTHMAILERRDAKERRSIIVPSGQSLEEDEDGQRRWLRPYLGHQWKFVEFLKITGEAT